MRTAAHRGTYKAKANATKPMPLLLRRALAQLRGDPPEIWPNALRAEPPPPGATYAAELYGPEFPFPTLSLPALLPGLRVAVTQAELRRMIDRLSRAPLNKAWRTLETRCAASRSIFPIDPGLVLLMALIESLVPINLLDRATVSKGVERIREAARELVDALEAYAAAGASLDWLMPPDPLALPPLTALLHEAIALDGTQRPRAAIRYALSRSETLLALLRSLAEREIGTIRQRRGSMAQRRAFAIAHRLRALAGPEAAVAIANAATGARITVRGLTKSRN